MPEFYCVAVRRHLNFPFPLCITPSLESVLDCCSTSPTGTCALTWHMCCALFTAVLKVLVFPICHSGFSSCGRAVHSRGVARGGQHTKFTTVFLGEQLSCIVASTAEACDVLLGLSVHNANITRNQSKERRRFPHEKSAIEKLDWVGGRWEGGGMGRKKARERTTPWLKCGSWSCTRSQPLAPAQ